LKALFAKYKSVIKFILTFLFVYTILSVSYKFYLDFSTGSKYYPDFATNLAARQIESLLQTVGYDASTLPHSEEASMKLIINDKFVARVIEGCNSLSVIILFVSFIVAFSEKWKPTIIYLLAGSVLIYIMNLARIVILSIGLYHYPWRREVLHNVIFPLIIYGMVFLLWMFWVNRYARLKKQNG
jgi:exosortase family protein XrtF